MTYFLVRHLSLILFYTLYLVCFYSDKLYSNFKSNYAVFPINRLKILKVCLFVRLHNLLHSYTLSRLQYYVTSIMG